MKLNFTKPIVFFDLESTGLSVQNDRIVEYCFIKVMPDQSRLSMSGLINPEKKIPQEVIDIHGITDERVKEAPTFSDKADEIIAFIDGCDLGGYNILNFDIPMLKSEFDRVKKSFNFDSCAFLDAQKIFFKKEPRNLAGALRFYCDKELINAHGAEADTIATIDVFFAQLDHYEDLPDTPLAIHQYCRECPPNWIEPSGRIRWKGNEAVIGFRSNFEGQTLESVTKDPKGKQFLTWIIKNNFSLEVKQICEEALKGNFPKKDK
ncbi:MAG: 3'-5' exonuclease [Lentisphaeria bacterium]|nr:3'-5' exonuclease [Lentisphaeria bacterium]